MSGRLEEIFAAAVARHAGRAAVRWRGGTLTYAELERRSARVARALGWAGVRPGERVGLLMQKSPVALAALLGSLRAGAAYVPLDARAPRARLAALAAQARLRALLCDEDVAPCACAVGDASGEAACHTLAVAEDGALVPLDAAQPRSGRAATAAPPERTAGAMADDPDVAAVLFTSGSTGDPKGAMITHRNVAAFSGWAIAAFALSPQARCVSHAPLHFDLSLLDVLVTLAVGGCVVLVPDSHAGNPRFLARTIEAERLTHWQSVPSALALLLRSGELERCRPDALRHVLFAGEAFPTAQARELARRVAPATLHNVYGCTETNDTFCYSLPADPTAIPDPLPIGSPLPGVVAHVADAALGALPTGAEGELLVRAPTVMKGYLGEGLGERNGFVTGPDGQRSYRTRDVVRRRRDGLVELVGRTDSIVKSNGHRVHLGEVERAVASHAAVAEAAVIALPDPDVGARLVAFVCARPGARLSAVALRVHCAAALPRYMVPARFEVVHGFLPRTVNGKVDRLALAQPTRLTA